MKQVLYVLALAIVPLCAQIEPTALLRGTIRDSSQPVRAELQFRDESGKTIRAKSASDGSYQVILPPGHSYGVTITTDNLDRYTFTYTVPPATKYMELTQDFSIGATFASASKQSEQPKPAQKKKVKKSKRRK